MMEDLVKRMYNRVLRFRNIIFLCSSVLLVLVLTNELALTTALFVLCLCCLVVALWRSSEGKSARAETLQVDQPEWPKLAGSLADSLHFPCFLLDQKANLIFANKAAHKLPFNLKINQPLSFTIRDPILLKALDTLIKTGNMQKVSYFDPVPLERWYEASLAIIHPNHHNNIDPNHHNNIDPSHHNEPDQFANEPDQSPTNESGEQFILLVLNDFTEFKRSEQMRQDFIANASHELRTPLANIGGYIETLSNAARNDAEARDKFLEIMAGQAGRMSRLIDDLLSLSQIEMQEHILPQGQVKLPLVIQSTLESVAIIAEQENIKLVYKSEVDEAIIQGHHDELVRVMINVVENAVRYGGEGSQVDITLDYYDGSEYQYIIIVRDYGEGIAKNHISRLTERFYRVNEELSRKKKGTGLGLAIVKHIVMRHRGQLRIESEIDEGTSVYIAFKEKIELDES